MSQIAPLLDALKKHNAEEICLEVGERIYMLQDGQRRNLGREPLQEETLEHTAQGVIGPDGVRSLSEGTAIRQHDPRRRELRGSASPSERNHRYTVAALASCSGAVAETNVGTCL